jgi:hypothetical protein
MHAQIVLFDGFDPLDVIALDSDQLTWKQAVTKPMRLNLTFTVTLADDTLTGTAKAERLPAAKVTGQRRTILATTEHRP